MKRKFDRTSLCVVCMLFAAVAGGLAAQQPVQDNEQQAHRQAEQNQRPIHRWAQENIRDQFPIPPTPFMPDLTPGYVLIEGDIQVPLEEYVALILGMDGVWGGPGIEFWGSEVPYDFVTTGSGAVEPLNQTRAIDAMNQIATFAGVTFRPAAWYDPSRIRFQASGYNSSPIGKRGGTQIINIASWGVQGVIIHEIMHSLGIWHEQSRADRDTYITVHYANICGESGCPPGTGSGECCLCVTAASVCISCAHNFEIREDATYWGPYDFGSLMHYGENAFSCTSLPTIIVNSPWTGTVIGQRAQASTFDKWTVRAIHPYDDDRWLSNEPPPYPTFPQIGVFNFPYRTFAAAFSATPSGGTLIVQTPGAHSAIGTWDKEITIESPAGLAILGD